MVLGNTVSPPVKSSKQIFNIGAEILVTVRETITSFLVRILFYSEVFETSGMFAALHGTESSRSCIRLRS